MAALRQRGVVGVVALAGAFAGALACAFALGCAGRGLMGDADLRGLPQMVKSGEALQMARALPAGMGSDAAVAFVVRTTDKRDELRVGERYAAGGKVTPASRPGDEFRK